MKKEIKIGLQARLLDLRSQRIKINHEIKNLLATIRKYNKDVMTEKQLRNLKYYTSTQDLSAPAAKAKRSKVDKKENA